MHIVVSYRRRTEREAKAKVITSVWGTEFIQILEERDELVQFFILSLN